MRQPRPRLWRGAVWEILVAFILVVSMAAPSGAAFASARDTATPTTLLLRTPEYHLSDTGITVPGYAAETTPGYPLLPVYGTLVALPPTGDWELAFETPGVQLLETRIAVPAVPVPDLDVSGAASWLTLPPEERPSAVPVVDRPDPAVYGVDAFHPAAPVVTGEPIWHGEQRLLPVRVYPFQYNPVTRRLRYYPEFRIQITPTAAQAGEPVGAAEAAAPAAALAPAATNALRIRTSSEGMHRLTYADLTAKGVPAGTSTASFAMTYLGQPIDIQVLDADGVFNSGDLVIFYAEAYRGRYMRDNVYFFSYGGALSGDRIAQRTVTPTGSEPVRTAMTRTLHIEFDEAYFGDYPLPSTADHFFDSPTLAVDGTTTVSTLNYDLALVDPLPTGQVAFRGQFYGVTEQATAPDQSVQVRLNSHMLGTFTWDGRVGHTPQATGPATWLDATPNTLTVEAALAQLPAVTGYSVYVDWLELDYPSLAKAQQDRLHIKGLNLAPTDTSVRVDTTGFTTDQVMVYDIRDPRQPVVLATPQAINTGAGYDVHFWDAWPAGSPAPSYFLTSQAALLAPTAVEVADAPAWNTAANNYDYIAIVHRSLWDAVQPLLNFRTAQGLRVAKVDVQHIYDLYSGGRMDPEAIRAFLTYAYFNWNPGGPRPHYVVLVGDGHYDFKNVLGTPMLNLIPPYLLHVDPWIGETAADNRYVSVNGPNDYIPDMALGRIPAQSPAELTTAVDKILRYEDATRPDYAPDGDWQKMVSFVADQADDPAGDFQAFSEDVRLNWLPASYDSRHVYWETDYQVANPDMVNAIKAALGDSIMLQWFGHASRFRWGSTQVFSTFSVKSMSPTAQWPLTADYSCWTGYFINLYNASGDYRSLSEVMLLTANQGSAATIGPSGLHVGGALLTLNQGLVKAIFQDEVLPVGDALNAAKQHFLANSNSWHDVVDTTVLFGDPAMRLRLPVDPKAAPNPPYIGISRAGSAVDLSWQHPDRTLTQYQVWRSEAPYFEPAQGQGTQIDSYSYLQSVYGEGAPFSYVDDGSCGYFVAGGQPLLPCAPQAPTTTVIGDPAHNYFWVVRGGNSSNEFADSNHVGVFNYALIKGD